MAPESAPRPDPACPLCGSSGTATRIEGPGSTAFHLCDRCSLIYRAPDSLPDAAAERARYLLHENGPQHAGYVAFLRQAIAPALPFLRPGLRGLDYGCGPAPTLSGMLREMSLDCADYDPFFLPDLPQGPFDFIFATEVVEHLHHPGAELTRIVNMLRPGGILTIMTELWTDVEAIATWSYASDPTHVCFYHARTIDFVCRAYGLEALDRESPRVSVLRRMT
ncbi:MAG: class I SAM-dependent methyltransferase [Anaerolineae bacterium]|nr:class I SAM-dependent methyltransferase [Anaerolineae bacterium]